MQLAYIGFFYLLGSIPVAWLMGRLAGQGDIRRLGSGNAGVMNVALNVSRWAALIVMAAETAKGIATVLLAQKWQLSEAMIGLAVVAAVVGGLKAAADAAIRWEWPRCWCWPGLLWLLDWRSGS